MRRAWPVACAAGLALAGCASPRQGKGLATTPLDQFKDAPVALYASFDDAEPSGWVPDSPEDWQVIDGRLTALVRGDHATAALYRESDWRDGLFETEYIRSPESVGAGGLVVRATPDFQPWRRGSGYMFAIGSDGLQWHEAVFVQSDGKVRFLRPWKPIRTVSNEANRLAAIMRGTSIQFYLNGEPRWAGTDRALGIGAIGVFATSSPEFETLHAFDHVRIRTPPEPAPQAVHAPDAPPVTAPRAPLPTETARARDAAPSVVLGPDRSPVLRPGLLVRVSVLVSGKREVDAEVKRVSDSNMLDLPLVGTVPVEGMTLSMLIADLQRRYQEFFINPQVIAEFVVDERPDAISPWGSVNVLGRVRSPGRVNIPPTQDLTVSAAIQQAGGLDTSARASSIRVTRRTEDGKRQRITVDLTAIGRQGEAENDLILRPGDIIFVPERIF
jgi:polysaccharide export outer membrane protein